jgi:hypothetical protein
VPTSEHDPEPLTDPPSYQRRPWSASFGALGHIDCVWQQLPCRSGSMLLTLLARPSEFFAWQLNIAESAVAGDSPARLAFVGGGARLYALERGRWDPFVGLSLGAEYARRSSRQKSFNLATELSFGLSWLVTERVQLNHVLNFRQGFRRVRSCGGGFGGCGSWLSQHDRWVALGIELSFALGEPL